MVGNANRRKRLRSGATSRLAKAKADAARDRSRLIDHFKRLYTIIVGLALTEACRKLLPFDTHTFSFASFWMFCAFIATVVPIFQGGDRSLDLKYLDQRGRASPKVWYIWDVVMLLITGMLFVAIAQSIPPAEPPSVKHPLAFFELFATLLLVDAIILGIDNMKSHVVDRLEPYAPWMGLNILTAIFSAAAGMVAAIEPAQTSALAALIFLVACLRSGVDYWLSRSFMFPA